MQWDIRTLGASDEKNVRPDLPRLEEGGAVGWAGGLEYTGVFWRLMTHSLTQQRLPLHQTALLSLELNMTKSWWVILESEMKVVSVCCLHIRVPSEACLSLIVGAVVLVSQSFHALYSLWLRVWGRPLSPVDDRILPVHYESGAVLSQPAAAGTHQDF